MIDMSECPRGIYMTGIPLSHDSRELAIAQNRNLEIFKWMGNEMLKMSEQIEKLEQEIEVLRKGESKETT